MHHLQVQVRCCGGRLRSSGPMAKGPSGWWLAISVTHGGLFLCTLAKIVDGFLGSAILGVGIDAKEGKALPICIATILECIVNKASIVAVDVEDADTALLGKVLEQALSIHGLF
jgi:hypothetical protein